MQFASTVCCRIVQPDIITSSITFGLLLIKPSGGVQRLMYITGVEESYKIVGF